MEETKDQSQPPDGSLFDVSQFKLQIGNDDIPEDVIEDLNQRFGDDMTGAIDYFYDTQMKKSTSELLGKDSAVREKDTEEQEAEAGNDPLGRKSFVIRERYWDEDNRQWCSRKFRNQESKSGRKEKRYVLVLLREYDEDTQSFNTFILIHGEILKSALQNIFRNTEGITVVDDEVTRLDPKFMYWAKPELELLANYYQDIGDRTGSFEVQAALDLVEKEFEPLIRILPSLVPHYITFDCLWALIPPDALIVGLDALDFTRIWRVSRHSIKKIDGEPVFVMYGEYLGWNGSKLGYISETLKMPLFSGMKLIKELPYIPLKYHPERAAVLEEVQSRNTKALRFWKPGFKLQEHHGTGLAEVNDKVQLYAFDGRVVIDPAMMRSADPSNAVLPRSRFDRDVSSVERAWLSDLTSDEQKSRVREKILKPDYETALATGIATEHQEDAGELNQKPLFHLSEEQTLLVSSMLYGYSLKEGTWGAFAVDRVADVIWNDAIFPNLIIDESLKSVVYQLVTAHVVQAIDFDDFVKGKGKGLVGLMFGPPGSGKTLTAEAIAEMARRPLYTVSSGALGHEPVEIQKKLSRMLKLASHWKAVLLLDEADVFLAERTLKDIRRNAIVSIFLRELEYYQGVLLLTTNQQQVIDEAFQSRIHFSLRYPDLNAVGRRKIWGNFIDSVRTRGIDIEVTAENLNTLAEMPLNGRQIKNAISVASKIAATSESHTLTLAVILASAKLLQSDLFKHTPLEAKEEPGTSSKERSQDSIGMLQKRAPSTTKDLLVKPAPVVEPNQKHSHLRVAVIASLGTFVTTLGIMHFLGHSSCISGTQSIVLT